MWQEQILKLVLVHGLGEVGHVEIGIVLVREGLELRVEGLLERQSDRMMCLEWWRQYSPSQS